MEKKKKWSVIPAWGALGVCTAFALHSWLPDSTRELFLRGQRLENLGQYGLALRAYHVLSSTHPESLWADDALDRQASILGMMGRNSGDAAQLREAMTLYRQLAHLYPASPLAGDALLSAGDIAFADLSDWKEARDLYTELLEGFGNSREYASQATLKLGRVALASGARDEARARFQEVLRLYPKLGERCAEAQFHLGVLYETLWSDKEHKQWAHNAYELTFTRYPGSIYAAKARDRLALLFYDEASRAPSSRVVLIDVPPIADDIVPQDPAASGTPSATPPGASASTYRDFLNRDGTNSMASALRLLLASRGLEVDEASLRGWSLRPFVAGLDPDAPGRVVEMSGADWENVLSNAGLRYLPTRGGNPREALRDLQKELDVARPPLLFNGRWSLAVGYDSSRGLVFLQGRGAKVESVSTLELSKTWDVESPIGGHFALLGAWAPGEKPQILPDKSPAGLQARAQPTRGPRSLEEPQAAAPTPAPTATPMPRLDTATYIYSLPKLPLAAAHERAMRRASSLLGRPRAGRVLLGASALDALASAFESAARPARQVLVESGPPPASPKSNPSAGGAEPEPDDLPARASSGAAPAMESPLPSGELPRPGEEAPAATAPAVPSPTRAADAGAGSGGSRRLVLVPNLGAARRALQLRAWFGEPLSAWLWQRRDAASFCESAGLQSRRPAWQQAGGELRASVAALEGARALMPLDAALQPGAGQTELSESARASLREVARMLRQASSGERRAAALMAR